MACSLTMKPKSLLIYIIVIIGLSSSVTAQAGWGDWFKNNWGKVALVGVAIVGIAAWSMYRWYKKEPQALPIAPKAAQTASGATQSAQPELPTLPTLPSARQAAPGPSPAPEQREFETKQRAAQSMTQAEEKLLDATTRAQLLEDQQRKLAIAFFSAVNDFNVQGPDYITLFNRGANINRAINDLGETPLIEAVRSGNVKTVRRLLNLRANIEITHKFTSITALQIACEKRNKLNKCNKELPEVQQAIANNDAAIQLLENEEQPAGQSPSYTSSSEDDASAAAGASSSSSSAASADPTLRR